VLSGEGRGCDITKRFKVEVYRKYIKSCSEGMGTYDRKPGLRTMGQKVRTVRVRF